VRVGNHADGSNLVPTEILTVEHRPERRPIHSVFGPKLSPSTNRTPLSVAARRLLVERAGRGARASAFTLGTEGHSANVCPCGNPPVRRPGGGVEERHSVASVVETSFREHETARAF
jgi:hypothetical protein